MPPVRKLSVSDGIYIELSDGTVFQQTAAEVQAKLTTYPGNLKKKESSYNNWLQAQVPFMKTYSLDEYEPDHQTHTDPDNLPVWRILSGAYVMEVTMWVAVHFYDDDPLRLTIKCQNKELGPIEGEWWL